MNDEINKMDLETKSDNNEINSVDISKEEIESMNSLETNLGFDISNKNVVEKQEKPPKKEKKKMSSKTMIILSLVVLIISFIVFLCIYLLDGKRELPKKLATEITTKEECTKYKYHWWNDKKVCLDNKKAEEIKEKEECLEFKYYWWSKNNTCNTLAPTLDIIDVKSKTRPIAVMINNHAQARPYHSGLQDANIVYEIIVEGGITRMMAVFKDKNTARIGSIRSSRHYFLDYALENDAIYVHFGWSPQAESDMRTLGVNNINGLYDSGFWRDTSLPVDYEHTAVNNIENIKQTANNKGYRMEYKSDNVLDEQVLKYSTDEIDLSGKEDSMVANNISIPYSYYMTSSYTYDPENRYYLRFANGKEHTDYVTKEQYHFKNIIIINVGNYSIDNYGRQTLENIGTGTGYYITDGYARPITWEKTSRSAKTIYRYSDGEEINVNDGNTFIQIEPSTQNATISE